MLTVCLVMGVVSEAHQPAGGTRGIWDDGGGACCWLGRLLILVQNDSGEKINFLFLQNVWNH
jgi:hypothetical protein